MVRVKNFLSILAKNGQSNLVLILVLVLESKGPYYYITQSRPSIAASMIPIGGLNWFLYFSLQIIFQGIRGDGYLSDFGLDDITLENNPCGLGLMRLTPINNRELLCL